MRSFLKKTLLSASLLMATSSANAGIPNTDYAQLGNKIVANLEEIFAHEGYMQLYDQVLEQYGNLTALSIDNENNAWANLTIRENQSLADIQNMEIMSKSMTAVSKDASVIGALIDECNSDRMVMSMEIEDQSTYTKSEKKRLENKGIVVNSKTIEEKKDDIVSRFSNSKNVCTLMSKNHIDSNGERAEMSLDEKDDTKNPTAISAQYLVGMLSDVNTYSAEQSQSVKDYIFLISPPYTTSAREEIDKQLDKTGMLKLKHAQEEVFRAFPRMILTKIASLKEPSQILGLSELDLLNWHSSEYMFDGASSINKTTLKIMTSNLATPSAILRDMALMKAHKVHMSVRQYKRSLDSEGISAIKLAHKLK